MYIKCSNINWDTDGEPLDSLNIPDNVIIQEPTEEMIDDINDAYNDAISDYLSDLYGFCVVSFEAELIK